MSQRLHGQPLNYHHAMPIYEFYCSSCHMVFSFLSRRVDTVSRPPCPKCSELLQREISPFSALLKRSGAADEDREDFPVDDSRLEQAMQQMTGDLENINEDDPRQAADLMRKFSRLSGLRFKGSVEEAISRMEAGEDPEEVESSLAGELEEDDNPFDLDQSNRAGGWRRLLAEPRRDRELREMPDQS